MRVRPGLIALALVGIGLIACAPTGAPGTTGDAAETPTPLSASADPELILTLTAGRLEKPAVFDHPTQAEQGALVYWLVCIPCHADRGQGLTDEWRLVFGPEDMDCWQSKCHAANHPPEGFIFPRTVPPVLGQGALSRLKNAGELYRVIADSMPWWNPDYISDEDAWNVTAYLMREDDTLPPRVTLDAGNAPVFRLHDVSINSHDERPDAVLLVGLVAIAAIGLTARAARRR